MNGKLKSFIFGFPERKSQINSDILYSPEMLVREMVRKMIGIQFKSKLKYR